MSYKDRDVMYDLYAVVNHMGGYQGGHYYCSAKNFLDRNWYEFNDKSVIKLYKESSIL